MRVRREFVNETGSVITIIIMQGTDPNKVALSIRGPHSISTNIVTRVEAENIHSALGEILKK